MFTFERLGTGGFTPPDINGRPNHYVQTVNVSFAGYDKSGNEVMGDTLFTDLFTGSGLTACENENNGDPIVLYDCTPKLQKLKKLVALCIRLL